MTRASRRCVTLATGLLLVGMAVANSDANSNTDRDAAVLVGVVAMFLAVIKRVGEVFDGLTISSDQFWRRVGVRQILSQLVARIVELEQGLGTGFAASSSVRGVADCRWR